MGNEGVKEKRKFHFMNASNHFFFVLTAAHKAVHTDQYETKAL